MELKDYVRSIPDFPKPGILFRDITPLLGNKDAFQEMVNRMADFLRDKDKPAGSSSAPPWPMP